MFIPGPKFSIPDPGSKRFPDPGFASTNLSILTQKIVLGNIIREPGTNIPDPYLDFSPIPVSDPGVRKAPDPGSGFATLHSATGILFLTVPGVSYSKLQFHSQYEGSGYTRIKTQE
jgi:hypothetical protein